MLTLRGRVENVFHREARVAKDGQKFEASEHVQLLCSQEMQNGDARMELVTLRTDRLDEFRAVEGQEIRCDVGAFVSGGQIRYFLPDKAAIEVMSQDRAQPPHTSRGSELASVAAG